MPHYGLIGYPLSHSFSQKYFTEKFSLLGLTDCHYFNFEIDAIEKLKEVIQSHSNLKGLNVTIPFKEKVIPLLNELDETAMEIGAVNTIKFFIDGDKKWLKGFNTDAFGFQHSLQPLLLPHYKKALILGTGGASKAVAYVLKRLGIDFHFVSRSKKATHFTYDDLNAELINEHLIIINTTPLGTYPQTDSCPTLPYEYLTDHHLCFDLIYNPTETLFLQKAKSKGATITNGLAMLRLQAERAWEIWQ